jgi:hypothetical protein
VVCFGEERFDESQDQHWSSFPSILKAFITGNFSNWIAWCASEKSGSTRTRMGSVFIRTHLGHIKFDRLITIRLKNRHSFPTGVGSDRRVAIRQDETGKMSRNRIIVRVVIYICIRAILEYLLHFIQWMQYLPSHLSDDGLERGKINKTNSWRLGVWAYIRISPYNQFTHFVQAEDT